MPSNTFQQDGSSFRRKLSKREKKQLKKEKLNRLKSSGANNENDARVAEKLYSGGYLLLIFFNPGLNLLVSSPSPTASFYSFY